MQKIETKAEVILFPCDLIPVEQIFMCYDKYNGIGDTYIIWGLFWRQKE